MKQECKQCGQCCRDVQLIYSPKELEDNYSGWAQGIEGHRGWTDIHLIYPMLEFIRYDKRDKKYHYRCKHLMWITIKNKKKAFCGINDNKPRMCSGFPYYNREDLYMNDVKPSQYKGCGYNLNQGEHS